MQLDLLMAALLCRVSLIFFQKQLRAGQPELIDALLHVAHHEHVGAAEALAADALDQRLLHHIAVLILVHQDFPKMFRQLVCHRAGASSSLRLLCQHLQGEMLEIVEIHHVPLPLRLLVAPGEFLRQRKEREKRPPAPDQILENRRLVP